MSVATSSPTILDAFELWRRSSAPRPRTVSDYRFALAAMARAGLLTVEDATPPRVFRWLVTERERGLKPVSINKALAALTSVLGALEKSGDFPEKRLRRIRRLKIKVRKPKRFTARFLTREQFDDLVARAARQEPRLVLPLLLAGLAGLRSGEVARLRSVDVDLAEKVLRVENMPDLDEEVKTGSARSVPLCSELLEALRERLVDLAPSDFLFSSLRWRKGCRGRPPVGPHVSTKVLGNKLRATVRGTKLEAKTVWPTLRHSRASWWVQAGVSIAKVASWLGHDIDVCARHYANLGAGFDEDVERGSRGRLVASSAPTTPHRRAFERGEFAGSEAPFGYRLVRQGDSRLLEVEPEEARVVRLVFAEYLRCRSLSGLATELEGRGVRSRKGNRFFPTPLRWILTNVVYTGRVRFGDDVVPASHERLVDEANFEAAARVLAETARVRS